MFDIGFLELMVVAVIGLLVIGPEKLPEAVKSCALWIARIKRVLRDARTEFEQQIGADEIRREIHNEQVLKSLQKLKEQREELERQIRQATVPDEEKYEDMHLVHHAQQPQTHSTPEADPSPDLEKSAKTPSETFTDTSTEKKSSEDVSKQHGV